MIKCYCLQGPLIGTVYKREGKDLCDLCFSTSIIMKMDMEKTT